MWSNLSPMLLILLEVLVSLAVIFIVYVKWSQQYWKHRKIPYIHPSFLIGNINYLDKSEPFSVSSWKLYETFRKQGHQHGGIYLFTSPTYMPIDPDYIKNVLTKDFQYFTDRGSYYNEEADPLSAHLFAIGGARWRNLRVKLTPTFTSGKMKMMFQTLLDCSGPMQEAIEDHHNKKEPLDIRSIMALFTVDVIGSCAFGLECNSFKDENTTFWNYGKTYMTRSLLKQFCYSVGHSYPNLMRRLGFRMIGPKVTDFYMNVVKDTMDHRTKNHLKRNDFLQMLMELKSGTGDPNGTANPSDNGASLTLEQCAAQCFVFFIAGFETSSSTTTFLMYELARHQDIQQKLRDEIHTVLGKHDGQITYEAINEMKYMSQVIDETLRKWPVVPFITRLCVKDYAVPGTDVVIEKGTKALISILGVHRNPEIYPDPEKFDPERFSDENRQRIPSHSYLPFGEGPRICIGMRFGLMQTKVGLVTLLRNHKFTLNKNTKYPLTLGKTSTVLAVDGNVLLDLEKIAPL